MTYFSDYDVVLMDIHKNGSNGLVKLFEYALKKEKNSNPYFIREPKYFIVVTRNPYDRLVSQFYHLNRSLLLNDYRYIPHFPIFRKWVKETYGNGYTQNDPHYLKQSYIIQYGKFPEINYIIFKMEDLVASELFWFLNLTDMEKKDIDRQYEKILLDLQSDGHHVTGTPIKQGIWQIFYDSECIKICNDFFYDDFINFEYNIIEPSEFKSPKRDFI